MATSSASQLSIRNIFSPSSSAVTTDAEESEASEGQASGQSSNALCDTSSNTAEEPSTVSTEEIATKKRKLSHHRKRGISSSWLKEFLWLCSMRGANGKLGMHIKTELRNRMNTSTLDKLLRIRLEGPDLSEFDFKETVKRWQSNKKCRLFSH